MDILQFDFMQNAFIASLLVSIICGIIGTLIVVNRMVFIAGGIAHGSYGGIGLAFYFESSSPSPTKIYLFLTWILPIYIIVIFMI